MTLLYEAGRFNVRRQTWHSPDGVDGEITYIEKRNAVSIIAVHEGRIAIAEEYRPLSGRKLLELPGGVIDEGEDAITAACRELMEEVGYEAEVIRPLWSGRPSHTVTTETLHCFLAERIRPAAAIAPPQEQIGIIWMSRNEALLALADYERWALTDALTLECWLRKTDF